MSKPRYNWWGFMLAMIRDYPARSQALKDLREQKITADLSGMPRGGGASRSTENLSLRQLPRQEQLEYDAVHTAVRRAQAQKEAALRMDVVKLTLWRGYTIPEAAIHTHTSESAAQLYRWQFIMWVGVAYGLITEAEYQTELKKRLGKIKV